jgi:hypothetical protein
VDAELIRLSEQLATTLGGAIAAKPLLERLMGPSFEYAGRSMAALLERYGNRNLNDVFRRAARKLGASDEPIGSVNPRVLRAVIEDASYTKDDVTAEYFAGLLASSAHGDSEDDRAMTFLSIVRSLTSSQIRFHRVAYSFFRVKYMSHEASLSDTASLPRLFLSDDTLHDYGLPATPSGRSEIIAGLARETLLGRNFELFRYALLPRAGDGLAGVVVEATSLGSQLFLWVHGQPDLAPDFLFDVDVELQDWERLESRKVGTGTEIDAHAEARKRLRKAIALAEFDDSRKQMKHPDEFWACLRELLEFGRFLTLDLYESLRALPSTPENAVARRIAGQLLVASDHVEGRRLG